MDFGSIIYKNAFADIKKYTPNRDDAILDSSLNWPENLPAKEARNIVNRFYATKGQGEPSKEKFKASNEVLGVDFRCNLEKYQCNASKANGERCTRKLAAGLPLCFQHCMSTFGVKISKTSLLDKDKKRINMLGLYACKKDGSSFQQDDVICPYIGEIRSYKELEDIYPGEASATYTLTMGGGNRKDVQKVDAACIRGIGSYVNTAPQEIIPSQEERELIKESGSSTKILKNNGSMGSARSNCGINLLVTNLSTRRVNGRKRNTAKNPQPWIVATREIKSGEELFAPIMSYNNVGPDDNAQTKGQNLKRTFCKH